MAPALAPGALADRAVAALVAEAVLTPKPGLVDRRGPGAHTDMTLPLLLASAAALRPAFLACATAGSAPGPGLRARLGEIGRAGEAAMLAATDGVNTHRGALWALGLLTAAAAADPADPLAGAAALAATPDPAGSPGRASHGQQVVRRYGVPGAAGEARAGFPHVVGHGLPVLRAARARGVGEESARLDALLAIMASLPDTCVLHRGGAAGLRALQAGAAAVLAAGGCGTSGGRRRLSTLDALARRRRLSPGGSADLLAATLFLDSLDGGAGADPAAAVPR
ncbi:MAG TPA: triphosphoribosyl-dephospho-CoA synthase [Mycobacteriales bacterium]|nr:triphosphoribosyl-dephospho-CoA synthase [Mycobacteriales bacterium]